MVSNIPPVVVLYNLGGILDDLATLESVFLSEVHPNQFARVEQPVIVIGQISLRGNVARKVTDILARIACALSSPEPNRL